MGDPVSLVPLGGSVCDRELQSCPVEKQSQSIRADSFEYSQESISDLDKPISHAVLCRDFPSSNNNKVRLDQIYQEKLGFLQSYYGYYVLDALEAGKYLNTWYQKQSDQLCRQGQIDAFDQEDFLKIIADNPRSLVDEEKKGIYWVIESYKDKPLDLNLDKIKFSTKTSPYDDDQIFGPLTTVTYRQSDTIDPVAKAYPTSQAMKLGDHYLIPTDDNYIFIPQRGQLEYQADTGQFYLKPDARDMRPRFLIYEKTPETMRALFDFLPDRPTYRPRHDPPRAHFDQFSKTAQRIIRGAEALMQKGKTERQVAFWIVQQSQEAWTNYEFNPPELSYVKRHKERAYHLFFDVIQRANCDLATIAAFEILRTALPNANVRFVAGFANQASEEGYEESRRLVLKEKRLHAWIEYVDPHTNRVYVLEATPSMSSSNFFDQAFLAATFSGDQRSDGLNPRQGYDLFPEIQIKEFSSSHRIVYTLDSVRGYDDDKFWREFKVSHHQLLQSDQVGAQLRYEGTPIRLPKNNEGLPLLFLPDDPSITYQLFFSSSNGHFYIKFPQSSSGDTIDGVLAPLNNGVRETFAFSETNFRIRPEDLPSDVKDIMEKVLEYHDPQWRELAFDLQDIRDFLLLHPKNRDVMWQFSLKLLRELFPHLSYKRFVNESYIGIYTALRAYSILPQETRVRIKETYRSDGTSQEVNLFLRIVDTGGKDQIPHYRKLTMRRGVSLSKEEWFDYNDKIQAQEVIGSERQSHPVMRYNRLWSRLRDASSVMSLDALSASLQDIEELGPLARRFPWDSKPGFQFPDDTLDTDYDLAPGKPASLSRPKLGQWQSKDSILLNGQAYTTLDSVLFHSKDSRVPHLFDENKFIDLMNQYVQTDSSKPLFKNPEDLRDLRFEKIIVEKVDEGRTENLDYYYNPDYRIMVKADAIDSVLLKTQGGRIYRFGFQFENLTEEEANTLLHDRKSSTKVKPYPHFNRLVLIRDESYQVSDFESLSGGVASIKANLRIHAKSTVNYNVYPSGQKPLTGMRYRHREYNLSEAWVQKLFTHLMQNEGQNLSRPRRPETNEEVQLVRKAYDFIESYVDMGEVSYYSGYSNTEINIEHMIYRLGMILYFINEVSRLEKNSGDDRGPVSTIKFTNPDCIPGLDDMEECNKGFPLEPDPDSKNKTRDSFSKEELLRKVYLSFKWLDENSFAFREELQKMESVKARGEPSPHYRGDVLLWYLELKNQSQ